MANQVTLTFAGDADEMVRAARRAADANDDAGAAARAAGDSYDQATAASSGFTDKLGRLGAATSGATDALDAAAGAAQAVADISTYAERKAQEHARALNDLKQAQEDANQAMLDGKQAVEDVAQAHIDAKQATLDQKVAQEEYNEAVKEHGANSNEAQQAAIDLEQANADLRQSQLDIEQANRDSAQSLIDLEAAQLDANDAMMAANPPELQKWADQIALITPLLSAVVGVIALVTAAQWLWNIAMTANPIGLIIVGIAALIAIIVLIATKTDWFQKLWAFHWKMIKDAAVAVWDWLQKVPGWIESAFKRISGAITTPFISAFNRVSDAWNSTVGSLSWSVPSWVPGIGGNRIDVPNIPRFHTGGVVPGMPGQEVLAVLQAGETVLPTQGGRGMGGGVLTVEGEREIVAFVRRIIRDYRLLDAY